MTTATKNILDQALNLNPAERAELIEELLHSFDRAGTAEIDALWAEEAESRIDAHDAGKISSDTAQAVFDRIRAQ